MILRFGSKLFTAAKRRYVRISRNQMMVLDALMEHGGQAKKYVDRAARLRYSEHFGMLDFDATSLERVIISAKTRREDANDKDILLPDDVAYAADFEYIFHTHPPTPTPGGRASEGILYEFPSINDIFHFIDIHRTGRCQGSIIIASEGLYILRGGPRLRRLQLSDEKMDSMHAALEKTQTAINQRAIKQYGKAFTQDEFYSLIAQNKTFFNDFYAHVRRAFGGQVRMRFYPRVEHKGRWVLPSILLPVQSLEPIRKNL